MTEITITPKTSYYAEGIELWDMRRVAIECGVSKARVLVLSNTEDFPNIFAVGGNGREFYPATEVRAWMLRTEGIRKEPSSAGKRRVGRPNVKDFGKLLKAVKQ